MYLSKNPLFHVVIYFRIGFQDFGVEIKGILCLIARITAIIG